LNIGKVAVAVFWLGFILSLVSVIPGDYASTIILLGCLILVIHLFQFLFVSSRLSTVDDKKIRFVQTMLFGFAYWLPLLKQQK